MVRELLTKIFGFMKKKKILLKLIFLFNTLYIYSDFQLVFDNSIKERTQEAVFFNPSMLDNIKSPEICLTYNILYPKLTDETKFVNNNICFTKEIFDGGLGLGYVQFGIKDWYIKDMFVISYGHELKPYVEKLSLGLRFVYTKEEYSLDEYMKQNPLFKDGNNSVGYFSLNLAAKYVLDTNNVLSLVVENLNQPNTAINTTDVLPLKLNFGYKYKYKKLNIMPELKTEISMLFDYIFGLATEYEFLFFNNKIKFVPTLSIEYGSREYNKILIGFEIKTAQISLVYGYNLSLTSKIDTGGLQYISLGYKFIPQPIEEEKVSKKEYEKLLLEKQQLEQQLEQIKKYSVEKPSTLATEQKVEEIKPLPTIEQPLSTEEILLKRLQELEQKLKEVETKKVEEKPKPTTGVSPTITTPPPAAKPTKKYHTVVVGDTLPKLAEKYYGDASQWRKIYEANKDKIIRGQLTPGTVLEIP